MSNFPRKVNVPEKFYEVMLQNIPVNSTMIDPSPRNTLLAKLANTSATARGRGMSRWLKGDTAVTEAEWNALYEMAAEGRARMQGANDRENELRAAICARALADRMEAIGVANPVVYTPKFTTKKTEEPAVTAPDTDLSSTVVPPQPPVVDQTADVDEADDDDLGYMQGELANS